jgi:hypothetical protein
MRTREGMKVARAKGRLRGKKPKLSPRQESHLVAVHHAGTHTSAELAKCSPSPGRPSTERSNAHAQPRSRRLLTSRPSTCASGQLREFRA